MSTILSIEYTCKCECKCVCPPYFTLDKNYHCACRQDCPPHYKLDKSTCQCICGHKCPPHFSLDHSKCQCECNRQCPSSTNLINQLANVNVIANVHVIFWIRRHHVSAFHVPPAINLIKAFTRSYAVPIMIKTVVMVAITSVTRDVLKHMMVNSKRSSREERSGLII